MKDILKILIIDDDEDDYFITNTYLGDIAEYQCQTIWAKNYAEGLEKIAQEQPDICFLDFLLGNKTGINLLTELREKGYDVPVILLTGKGDKHIDRQAMDLGATDYLVKSELTSEIIERSIRYSLSHIKTLRALRYQAQLYQTIFNKSKNMIYLVDADTLKFVQVNDRVSEILGYSKAHFLENLSFYDLFESRQDAEKIVKILRGGVKDITDQEVVLKTDKGTTRKCLFSAVPHRIADGTQQFHGTVSDMTILYQAEQDRLIAEKMAATSRFTRALAHEVRNPLTNIDLSAEQMESEYPDADWLDYVHIIKRNSNRIGTLITELLHNSNPLNLEFSTHKLHDLLDQTLDMVNDRLTLKNIALVKNYYLHNPSLLAAAESFKIAVLNILVNAIEAISTENGKIIVSSGLHNEDCYISIEDNGCGIAEEQLTRIFEPYVTTKQKGTGLGLITTLNVIKAHKGVIRVSSTVGQGTKFFITLQPISISHGKASF
jgi:PAS domain S-box-containing protein